jgi:hypothetical protein
MVPAFRFQSWKFAAAHLSAAGADTELLETTTAWLKKDSVAVLTIL